MGFGNKESLFYYVAWPRRFGTRALNWNKTTKIILELPIFAHSLYSHWVYDMQKVTQ